METRTMSNAEMITMPMTAMPMTSVQIVDRTLAAAPAASGSVRPRALCAPSNLAVSHPAGSRVLATSWIGADFGTDTRPSVVNHGTAAVTKQDRPPRGAPR